MILRARCLGADGRRLHEELVAAGGLLREGRFARLGVDETEQALAAALPGAVPEPLSYSAFFCGKPAEGSQTRELLVDASAGSLFIDWNFSRPAKNLIHVDYTVRSGDEEITGGADLQVQQSL